MGLPQQGQQNPQEKWMVISKHQKKIIINKNQNNFSPPRLTLREIVKGCSSRRRKTIPNTNRNTGRMEETGKQKLLGKPRGLLSVNNNDDNVLRSLKYFWIYNIQLKQHMS